MAMPGANVGPSDANGRLIAGTLALLGGVTALDPFFQPVGFVTWVVCAAMFYAALVLIIGGFQEGTAVFGFPLLILAVLDGVLPLWHLGYWGLIGGIVLAVGAFTTARTRACPVNRATGVNTAAGH
jgi:hypothetical protein